MTVILVDPRRPAMVPVEAVDLLQGDVQYTEEMPIRVPWSLPSARPALLGDIDDRAPVLLSSDPTHPAVRDRVERTAAVFDGVRYGDRPATRAQAKPNSGCRATASRAAPSASASSMR